MSFFISLQWSCCSFDVKKPHRKLTAPTACARCLDKQNRHINHKGSTRVQGTKRIEKEKRKNYAGSKTLPASVKEKETHWPEKCAVTVLGQWQPISLHRIWLPAIPIGKHLDTNETMPSSANSTEPLRSPLFGTGMDGKWYWILYHASMQDQNVHSKGCARSKMPRTKKSLTWFFSILWCLHESDISESLHRNKGFSLAPNQHQGWCTFFLTKSKVIQGVIFPASVQATGPYWRQLR